MTKLGYATLVFYAGVIGIKMTWRTAFVKIILQYQIKKTNKLGEDQIIRKINAENAKLHT